MRFAVAALALIFALPAAAQTVTDGDTIKLNGTIYRLWGIDAPETKQTYADGGAAGREATDFMRELVKSHAIACEARGKDRYGRAIGLCKADGEHLSAAMVSGGAAWGFNCEFADPGRGRHNGNYQTTLPVWSAQYIAYKIAQTPAWPAA